MISIRKAEIKDIPAILALYADIDMAGEASLSFQDAQIVFSKIQSYPNYHIYVATSMGAIIGTFALLIMDNLAHKGKPSGIVEDVVVRRDWQRKGVGKEMMAYAMKICKEEGCYKMVLSSNMVREEAHQFYEALGFKRHGYSFVVEIPR